MLAQLLMAPVSSCYTYNLEIEDAAFSHPVECREDHPVSEIAGHAKDYQRICLHHRAMVFTHRSTISFLVMPVILNVNLVDIAGRQNNVNCF
jgi:hypothetical protein